MTNEGNAKQKKELESRLRHFLQELTRLTQIYNISIGGCGCCGSPNLGLLHDATEGFYEVFPDFLKYPDDVDFESADWSIGDELRWVSKCAEGWMAGNYPEKP